MLAAALAPPNTLLAAGLFISRINLRPLKRSRLLIKSDRSAICPSQSRTPAGPFFVFSPPGGTRACRFKYGAGEGRWVVGGVSSLVHLPDVFQKGRLSPDEFEFYQGFYLLPLSVSAFLVNAKRVFYRSIFVRPINVVFFF